MSTPHRIQRLLESRQIDEINTADPDIAALWQKAVASAREARVLTSLDNQYVLGYQALLQMSTAVLACAGYRTRGAQGHHANTFYAVEALQIAGLEKININMEGVRQMRKVSAYEPGPPTPEQVQRLNALMDALMPAARKWLPARRPSASFTPYEPR